MLVKSAVLLVRDIRNILIIEKKIRLDARYTDVKEVVINLLEKKQPLIRYKIKQLSKYKYFSKEFEEICDKVFKELNIAP